MFFLGRCFFERDPGTGVFLSILGNFSEHLFLIEHLRWLLLGIVLVFLTLTLNIFLAAGMISKIPVVEFNFDRNCS